MRFDGKQDANSLRRKQRAKPASGKKFLIVTEGEQTEPKYLEALRVRLGLRAGVDVQVVHPNGTDPMTLVDYAVARKRAQAAKARGGSAVNYDEIWVVYDMEKIHDQRRQLSKRAQDKGIANGIRFACSDPAFEFWFLLHYKYTAAAFESCDAVIAALVAFWADYEKSQDTPADLLDRTQVATVNSERCRRHHKEARGDGNPSTDMDLLVKELNYAARLEKRLI